MLFGLTLLSLPLSAFGAPSISALDSVAGIATEIVAEGFEANESFDVVVRPPLGPELVIPLSSDNEGIANEWIAGSELTEAGTYEVTIEKNGDSLPVDARFTILPDTVDPYMSTIEIANPEVTPDGIDTANVTVVLRDQYGNTLPGRVIELISDRASDEVQAMTKETDDAGEQVFRITAHEPGSITLRALDLFSSKLLTAEGMIFAGNMEQSVGGYYPPRRPIPRAAPPQETSGSRFAASFLGRRLYGQAIGSERLDGFVIYAPEEMKVNEDATITLEAVDEFGELVEEYEGTVFLSTDDADPKALLPLGGIVKFEPGNLGRKKLSLGLRLRTPGERLIYVEDSEDGTLNGYALINVIGDRIEDNLEEAFEINEPIPNSLYGNTEITVKGNGPPFINIIVKGGAKDIDGETDRDGNFTIDIELDSEKEEHILQVTAQEEGRYKAAEVVVLLDVTPPDTDSIAFSPEEPEEFSDVLLVVESEPDLEHVAALLNDEEFELTQTKKGSGKYQVLIKAPEAGVYQSTITLTDKLGNVTGKRATLAVSLRGLPPVQNLVAQPDASAVILRWNPIKTEEVDAYRIYVGTESNDYLYTLDTDKDTTSATVAGLRPGTTYHFAVTAIEGKRESEEKSDEASAVVLGVTIDVHPQDSALLLEWANIQEELPLSSFLLEYGVEEDVFVEQRILNGELRAYTLRDLINGVQYYAQLTPVTTTGDKLEDLSAAGAGTPDGSGFRPSAPDPIPLEYRHGRPSAPPAPKTPRPPATSDTGIPVSAWWIVAVIGLFFIGITLHQRRMRHMTADFLDSMENRYHDDR